jgi:DNA-binding NarL/FixJ family response regulator
MIRDRCAQPVAVAQFGRECGSGVARAALRRNWTIRDADEPGFVRWAMTQGVRVLVVQLEEASEGALRVVERLSMHWNPVSCVVVGPVGGMDLELTARRAGAAAYVPASASVEELERLASALSAAKSGTAVARVTHARNERAV